MGLQVTWFVLIGVLWTGYFVLEGFDFGVGMLLPALGRNEGDRSVMFQSIGPVWDGNEVWLVVAGAATFAAFPRWYATLFSGFYLALLLILVLLAVRVVSFEWRRKIELGGWRTFWTWMNFAGSLGVPLLWGIALTNLLRGVPIGSDQNYAGNFWDLFSGYTVLAGIAFVLIFALHGAVYLSLRTEGGLRARARDLAGRLSVVAVLAGAVFLVWTMVVGSQQNQKDLSPGAIVAVIAALALLSAVVLVRLDRDAAAFAATALTVAAAVTTLFVELYPRVMVSSPNFANSLTIQNSSSSQYTLTVMSVAAGILLPVVLLYQGWSYRVFRARLRSEPMGSMIDLVLPRPGRSPATGD